LLSPLYKLPKNPRPPFTQRLRHYRAPRAPENPFAKYVGALPAFSGVHEVNAWVQTLRDEETQEQ